MLVRYRNIVYDSARWEGFAFREGDIVISTPPKCGTTWTQMLVAMLVFDATDFYQRLARISPWLDMLTRPLDSVLADLDAQTHRRFVKTHTPLDGVPFDERVTYVCVDQGLWHDNASFFHRGVTGQWRELLDADGVARYEARVAELVPPDLAEWSHRGWLGSSLSPSPS